MPAYRKITDNHEKFVRVAGMLKENLEEKNRKHEEKSYEMLGKLDEFESVKQGVYDKYSSCLMLQNRFTKRQLLTILEQQIGGQKETYTDTQLGERLVSSGSADQMTDHLMKFVEGRSQVHLNYIRCEKLKENLA